MSKLIDFEGLMAPTFTPFDASGALNCTVIESYVKHLKSKGIDAILINGTSGEGMLMSVDERKKSTESWNEACRKHKVLMMVQIAGCSFADVIALAEHAESVKVDGVLCLPELYFKPKSPQHLVDYLREISKHCPTCPLYYYHIPMFSGVNLQMANVMELAKREIPTFAGIKFTSGDLERGLPCLRHGQVYLGSDTILCGALALGFNSAIMTSLNIRPELAITIVKHMRRGEVVKAREQQMVLNAFVEETLRAGGGDWVPSMKAAFNKAFPHLPMGGARKPL